MNDSQPQLDYLREFTPDVVGALTNLGQVSAYYDANGHYARTSPMFGAFGLDGANQLTDKPPFERYQGLQVVHSRCPGGSRPAAAGRFRAAGRARLSDTSSTPPGP